MIYQVKVCFLEQEEFQTYPNHLYKDRIQINLIFFRKNLLKIMMQKNHL